MANDTYRINRTESPTLRILLLEDNYTDAELEKREIAGSRIPVEICTASNESNYRDRLNNEEPDIVLADYKLPGFNGEKALKIARERFPDIPFIFVTGQLGEEKAIELMKRGATDCVFKYNLKHLVPALERARSIVLERKFRRIVQRNLEDNVRLLRTIGDALPIPLFVKNTNRYFVMCNEHFARWFGMTTDQVIGKRADEFLSGEEALSIRRMDDEVLEKKDVQGREFSLVLNDGMKHDLISYRAALRNAEGRIDGIVGASIDVTERNEMLAQLREYSGRQEAVLSHLYEAVLLIDPYSRTIQLANRAVRDIFGYNPEELIGLSTEVVHIDREHYKEFADTGDPILAQKGVFTTEFQLKRKDGSRFDAHITVSITDKEMGLKEGVVSVIRDITEKKRAEQERRRYEQEMRALVENAPDIILRSDLELKTLYVNPAIKTLIGISPQELTGKAPKELDNLFEADAFDMEKWIGALKRVIESKTETSEELSLRADRLGGQKKWFQARVVPEISEEGTLKSVLSIIRDITEHKKAEEKLHVNEQHLRQSQKMEAVGKLASGVAHDFNNMLSAIRGYTELALMKADAPDKVREYLHEITKAGKRASRLTDQLLLFSRKTPMEKRPLDINQTVRDLLKMLQHLLGEHYSVQTRLDADGLLVEADEGKIEQVLMNLVLNARDAMPEGGTITISTSEQTSENLPIEYTDNSIPKSYLLLAVADEGEGMDEETRERIFEPFFTTKDPHKGTGMGLPVVFGIVEEHRGCIRARSTPGRGSTLQVFLPTLKSSEEYLRQDEEEPPFEQAVGKGKSVLIIEDDEQIRELLQSGLEAHGYRVLICGNVKSASNYLDSSAQEMDIVLSDVVLPDGDGVELYQQYKGHIHLPFVFMSGYVSHSTSRKRIEEEELILVRKPLTVRKIIRTIEEVMKHA